MKNIPIGQLLLEQHFITQDQLESALEQQTSGDKKRRIGDVLIDMGVITEEDLVQALSIRLHVPIYPEFEINVSKEIAAMLSETIARKYQVMPIEVKNNSLSLAMHDPLDLYAMEEIKANCGIPIAPMLATKTKILNAINRNYSAANVTNAISEMNKEYQAMSRLLEQQEDLLELTDRVDNAPLVKFVNNLITQAYEQGASDIHIEPFEKLVRIRIRIDGVLKEFITVSKAVQDPLLTRLKIIGGMNIAEKRIPQDGRIDLTVNNKDVDIRISVLPTIHGEKVVIRLLGHSLQALTTFDDLGLQGENKELFHRIIQSPYGIILITGPTGSGKTTSLYAALQQLATEKVNVVTIEDPVEKRMQYVNQIQVNNKTGLTFASGLRSILRQDPDIIMVGEIRDEETAEIAVRSAITGHLVLSTLHTNDTATTIARLRDMKIDTYLIAASIVGIIAQRLTRKLCPHCKKEFELSDKARNLLRNQVTHAYESTGCPKCSYTGYSGRIAIFEIMRMSAKLKEMIVEDCSIEQIKEQAREEGMTTLYHNMLELVCQGVTSMEEFVRVVYDSAEKDRNEETTAA